MIISALVVEIQNMTGSMAQTVVETVMNITMNATTSEANIEVVKEAAIEVAGEEDGMNATVTRTIEIAIGTQHKGADQVGLAARHALNTEEEDETLDPTVLVDSLSHKHLLHRTQNKDQPALP